MWGIFGFIGRAPPRLEPAVFVGRSYRETLLSLAGTRMDRMNLTLIVDFFWRRWRELLDGAFWAHVLRAARERFRLARRVSAREFQTNLRAVEKRPWNLSVELTNICNANCIFCAYQYQARKKMVMEERVFLKALDDYCAIGGGELKLQVVVGDPLVDKDFVKRVREARNRPQIRSIETITNGILLHKHGVSEILASGLSGITISLAAFDGDLYEKVYRNKNYPKVRDNVYALLRANSEMGNPVRMRLGFRSNLTMKETLDLPDYQQLKSFPHEVVFNTDYDTWTGEIRQQDLLEGMHLRPLSKFDKEPCFWLYDGPIIFADGRVGLCGCRDYNAASELVVGHIMEESLISIWQSERVRKLREKFRQRNLPDICRICTTYANLGLYRCRRGSERREFINLVYPTSAHQSERRPVEHGKLAQKHGENGYGSGVPEGTHR